jgi:CTP:molybdopterin cytidylyltransferase MocA
MVRDLSLPIEVVSVPTVRDRDGLALSSRNRYLSKPQRATATALFRSLELAKLLITAGERRARTVKDRVTRLLVDSGVTKVDYVAIIDPETLEDVKYVSSDVRVAVAAWIGDARLIDNIAVEFPRADKPATRIRGDFACVIMAAGEGKRMKSSLPKVMHRVGDKPMVEHVVRAARGAGIKDIVVVVGHGSKEVEPIVRRLRVRTARQDVPRGTGHAVLQAYPFLKGFKGNVVVLSGDTPLIRASTVRHMCETHARHSNGITFASAVVPDARGYGRIARDGNGCFERIVEEKDAGAAIRKIKEINAGLYCFRAQPLFDALLAVTADNTQMEYYLPDAIEALKARGGRVEAVVIDDYTEMLGVNTPEELAAVNGIYVRRGRHGHHKRGVEDGVHRRGR